MAICPYCSSSEIHPLHSSVIGGMSFFSGTACRACGREQPDSYTPDLAAVDRQMAVDDGGSAFPLGTPSLRDGMTLRDWFAGQALNGVIRAVAAENGSWNESTAADIAYRFADAMIAHRKGGRS